MRKLILLLCILMTYGCATMTYTAPDGTRVTYTRFMTGSDQIIGKTGNATIESKGQKTIDPEVLEAIINILGAGK